MEKLTTIYNDRSRADLFASGGRPMAVLKMPGCVKRLVNKAHGRWINLNAPVVSTGEEFLARMKTPMVETEPVICYCEEASLITALEREHCGFERCYDALEGKPYGLVSTSVIFQMAMQDVAGGTRGYDVFRLLALRDDSGKEPVLQAILVKLPDLSLKIKTIEGGARPILKVGFYAKKKPVLSSEVKLAKSSTYMRYARVVDTAIEDLKAGVKAKEVLPKALDSAKKIVPDYFAAQSLLLKAFKHQHIRSLVALRERLFDAVAAHELLPGIEAYMAREVFGKVEKPARPAMRLPIFMQRVKG